MNNIVEFPGKPPENPEVPPVRVNFAKGVGIQQNCHLVYINGALVGIIRNNAQSARPFSLELTGTFFLENGTATEKFQSRGCFNRRHFLTLHSAKSAVQEAIIDLYRERKGGRNGNS